MLGDLRIGAYVLTGDSTWLASSLRRYYDVLDELVVLVPRDGRSWTGKALPVEDCLRAIEAVDTDNKRRIVEGEWTNPADPLRAENAQRQAGVEHLAGCDWILQIDNDELIPASERLLPVLQLADQLGVDAVEWPMLVLFRRLSPETYLAVTDATGRERFEYPGSVAVKSGVRLVDCRRASGTFLRPTVVGDDRSLQLTRPPVEGEHREELLSAEEAIVHNSWGREPASIWRKLGSSSHQMGLRRPFYFAAVWLLAPLRWRRMRDFHPFIHGLWPRLAKYEVARELLVDRDRR